MTVRQHPSLHILWVTWPCIHYIDLLCDDAFTYLIYISTANAFCVAQYKGPVQAQVLHPKLRGEVQYLLVLKHSYRFPLLYMIYELINMCCIANDMLSTTDIENKFEASFRTKICQRIHTHCGTKIHVEMLARTHTNTDSAHLCQAAQKTQPNQSHASTHIVSNLCIYHLILDVFTLVGVW